MKEAITSFFDNLRQKSTNPFFGTLIITWSIKNWKLFYTIWNFDPNTSLEDKIKAIEPYFETWSFLCNLSVCILISFAVIVITYLLLNATRYISNIFENRVTPYIYKKSDPKNIVTKEIYDKLEKRYFNINAKLEDQKKELIELNDEIQKIVTENTVLKNDLATARTGNEELSGKNSKLKEEIEPLKSEVKNLNTKLDEERYLRRNIEKINHELEETIETLKNEKTSILNKLEDSKTKTHDSSITHFDYDNNNQLPGQINMLEFNDYLKNVILSKNQKGIENILRSINSKPKNSNYKNSLRLFLISNPELFNELYTTNSTNILYQLKKLFYENGTLQIKDLKLTPNKEMLNKLSGLKDYFPDHIPNNTYYYKDDKNIDDNFGKK